MEERFILNLIDTALKGDKVTVQMAVRKFASKIRADNPVLYREIADRLSSAALRSATIKRQPLPVDSDSRQSLARVEEPTLIPYAPVYSEPVSKALKQVLLERKYSDALLSEGLQPTKSLIFQGPPGVGKTMSARWLASKLELPLLVLDLAAVMSSFLGKTGSNVRAVIDHAVSFPCVLLLDEFDAIAKRRDDDRELGELKRLVTVLLQTIDEWPSTSLLIAATNHGELLDPAIWRRFDMEVAFTMPTQPMIDEYLSIYWPEFLSDKSKDTEQFAGMSFSDIDRELRLHKRKNVISALVLRDFVGETTDSYSELSMDDKKNIAIQLYRQGFSQRSIAAKLGISRTTVKSSIDSIN